MARRFPVGVVAGWLSLVLVVFTIGYGSISGVGRNFDFRAYYSAGELIRSAPAKLYDLEAQYEQQSTVVNPHAPLPFYHPAYEAVLFVPLTLLSYRNAYLVYLGWNFLLLAACYLVAPHSESIERFRPLLFFVYVPILICLIFGQDSLLFLLLLCLVWRLLSRDRDGWAGVVLALALFKLSVIPLMAALLMLRRGWRFRWGFLATAAVLVGVCVWITGFAGAADYLHLLFRASLIGNSGMQAQRSIAAFPGLMPTLHGFLYLASDHWLAPRTFMVTLAVARIAVLTVGILLMRRAEGLSEAFCAALLCGILLSPHFYCYDLTVLLLPLLLLNGRRHGAVTAASLLSGLALPKLLPLFAAGWLAVLPAALLAETAPAAVPEVAGEAIALDREGGTPPTVPLGSGE